MSETAEDRTAVVVEDDDDIRGLLVAVLTQAGFTVHPAATGRDGVEQVRAHQPLVTTLDLSLPDIDGLEVARQIRTFSPTYLVMLTAHAGEVDALLGLEAGADEYITKPFRPRELRARVEAMLRRPRQQVTGPADAVGAAGFAGFGGAAGFAGFGGAAGVPAGSGTAVRTAAGASHASGGSHPVPATSGRPVPAATLRAVGLEGHGRAAVGTALAPSSADLLPGRAAPSPGGLLTHGALRLDVGAREAFVDGVEVHLTPTEFALLRALLRAPGTVVAKAKLVGHVRAGSYAVSDAVADADRRGVEVHLANLRRKLGDDAAHPRFIETVRGVGYRMLPAR
ncbi:response regulator transcription factor [Georgenia yuyongxinii]